MAIEMGKKYRTRDGRNARILCVDGPHERWPVVGCIKGDSSITMWDTKGMYNVFGYHRKDLIEISPYSDIAIDAPGWARSGKRWYPRHFAGIETTSGLPMAWDVGKTSHTANGDYNVWDEFTTTKPEGL